MIYFFQTYTPQTRQPGHATQLMRVLPGQPDWRRNEASTEIKVQSSVADTRLRLSYPAGMIFACKKQGSTRSVRYLFKYTRNGENFYRADNLVPLFLNQDRSLNRVEYHRRTVAVPDWLEENWTAYRATIEVPETAALLRAVLDAYPYQIASQAAPRVEAPAAPQPTPAPAQSQPQSDNARPFDNVAPMGRYEKIRSIENVVGKHLAYRISFLCDMMALGVVYFEYDKQNGDRRKARGTLMPGLLPPGAARTDSRDTNADGEHLCYYDMDRDDWRCFCCDSFKGIVANRIFLRHEESWINRATGETVRELPPLD